MTEPDTSTATAAEPLDIGERLELFVDNTLIETMERVSLRLHSPRKMPLPQNPLTGGYMTVIKDGDLYRGYARHYKPGFKGERVDGNRGECTCYSESRDGIEWMEPGLALLEDDIFGNIKNAILDAAPFAHNFSPFLDVRPGVADDARYKALAGTRGSGLHAFASGDGIRWRKLGDEAAIPFNPELHGHNAFDSQNVAFWSEAEQRYVAFFRHVKTPQGALRTISRATSEDFVTWTDESSTFVPPNLPGEELYTNQTHPYFRAPHIYVALPSRFTQGTVGGQPVEGNLGSTDIMLMTCRAGANAYDRLFKETFIRPGLDPAGWENRANYVALNVVPTGPAEMSIYNRDGHRYVMRYDGFVSVNAPADGGELITKPVIFSGNQLVLNLSTSIRGSVRVELQDAGGHVLPGLTLDDCDAIIGDNVEHVVTWRGNSNTGQHADQPVRMRFVMQDSDLFSFRFRNRQG